MEETGVSCRVLVDYSSALHGYSLEEVGCPNAFGHGNRQGHSAGALRAGTKVELDG